MMRPGASTGSTVSMLADVLSWRAPCSQQIHALQDRYVEALCSSLGRVLGALHLVQPDVSATIKARLGVISNDQLVRALLLPATSRRLITSLHDHADVSAHLESVLRNTSSGRDSAESFGNILGSVPVFAAPSTHPALEPTKARIDAGASVVATRCPVVGVYLPAVIREIHLRIDPARDAFFSNSPQGFVGRVVITNPHLPVVDDVMIVEAVVHEATHAFVGMSEAIGLSGLDDDEAWLLDNGPYDGVSRVVSPWTGRPLDIPTYLHACFVWWALLNLWTTLSGTADFDERRVRSRMLRSARGFMGGALVDELRPHRSIVAPALLDVLEELSRVVDDLLSDSGLRRIVSALPLGTNS